MTSEPTLAAQLSGFGCALPGCTRAGVRFEAARGFRAGPFPGLAFFFEAAPFEPLVFAGAVAPVRVLRPVRAFEADDLGDLAIACPFG